MLARLPDRPRDDLLSRCRYKHFASGQRLLRQGDLGQYAILLLDGLVKIGVVDPTGFVAVLALRRRGDIVGELGALTGEPRTASVTAVTPVRGGVVMGQDLMEVVTVHPVASRELMRTQGRRLSWANQRRVDFAARPAIRRVARVLSDLAIENDQNGATTKIFLSQSELASLVGVALNTVEQSLRRLAEIGLVIRHRQAITVSDPRRLRSYAEAELLNP